MSELGLPFRGILYYWIEDSYGSTTIPVPLPISSKILDARPGIGDKHKPLRGIDSPRVSHLLEQATDPTFHLEYIPQVGDTLIEDVVNRTSEGKLQSLGFELGTNVNITATDKSYFLMEGLKPKTVRIAASFNTEYVITIDFSVKTVDPSTAATESAPTALTGDYLAFHVAGGIAKDGGDFAYITDSIDITIEHNLTDKWDHDSLIKQFAIEGAIDVDGTIDISLDEGGSAHWTEIQAQTEFDVVIDLGGVGGPRLTIPNAKWKSGEFDVNISGEPMMDSAPFTMHADSDTEAFNIVSTTA